MNNSYYEDDSPKSTLEGRKKYYIVIKMCSSHEIKIDNLEKWELRDLIELCEESKSIEYYFFHEQWKKN